MQFFIFWFFFYFVFVIDSYFLGLKKEFFLRLKEIDVNDDFDDDLFFEDDVEIVLDS